MLFAEERYRFVNGRKTSKQSESYQAGAFPGADAARYTECS